jgi:hypothetical protein
MNERRFSKEIERLRASERVARMEIDRMIDLSMAAPVPDSIRTYAVDREKATF